MSEGVYQFETVEYDALLGYKKKPGRLWTKLSKIVRTEGDQSCYTCGKKFESWQDSQAGHCVGGRSKSRLPDDFLLEFEEISKRRKQMLIPFGTPWYLFAPLLRQQCNLCNGSMQSKFISRNHGHGMYAEFQGRLLQEKVISKTLLERYKGLGKQGGKRPPLEELYVLEQLYNRRLGIRSKQKG